MKTPEIRAACVGDQAAIIGIALSSGLFGPEESPLVDGMLQEHFDKSPAQHHWIVAVTDRILGAAYVAPEPMVEGVLNLYFVAVSPAVQRQRLGSLLLAEVERIAKAAHARVLLIETSSAPEQAAARAFYEGRGYQRQGRIQDYYQAGEDKIIFARDMLLST